MEAQIALKDKDKKNSYKFYGFPTQKKANFEWLDKLVQQATALGQSVSVKRRGRKSNKDKMLQATESVQSVKTTKRMCKTNDDYDSGIGSSSKSSKRSAKTHTTKQQNEQEALTDEQLEARLKGDTIGDTIYTERFVLNTLLQLQKTLHTPLENNEEFDQQLCQLWDMTADTAVVNYMISQGTISLFVDCIETSQDDRLLELLVGMLANMCIHQLAIEELSKTQFASICLQMCASNTTALLIQLMRLLQTVINFGYAAVVGVWVQHMCDLPRFMSNFIFILKSTADGELARLSLQVLYGIVQQCAKYHQDFGRFFRQTNLIDATKEAFRTQQPSAVEELQANDELRCITDYLCFLQDSLNGLTSNEYVALSHTVYDCVELILQLLDDEQVLMPMRGNVAQALHYIRIFFEHPCVCYHKGCTQKLLSIWLKLLQQHVNPPLSSSDFEANFVEDEEQTSFEVVSLELLESICLLLQHVQRTQQSRFFGRFSNKDVQTFRQHLLQLNQSNDFVSSALDNLNANFASKEK